MTNLSVFKKYIFSLLIVVLFSCNDNKEPNKNTEIVNSIENSTIDKKEYDVDYGEKEIYMSMNNDKYLLRVIPDSTTTRDNMSYSILMTLKSDVIINTKVNIDSINKNYYYNKNNVKGKSIDFKENYYLSGIDIENGRARTNTLYLTAKINSIVDTTRFHMSLDFKYYGDEMGKLYMYNIYENK